MSAEERGRPLAERAAGHSRTLQGTLPPQSFGSLVAIATAFCIAPGRHEGGICQFQMFFKALAAREFIPGRELTLEVGF